mgnify:CR=1 FL=1
MHRQQDLYSWSQKICKEEVEENEQSKWIIWKRIMCGKFRNWIFYQDLKKQNVKAVHVAWKPVAGGDKKIAGYLKQLKDPKLAEKIEAANKEALRRILAAQPALVGMSTAGEAIPGMTKTTILHAGPPVKWENMCGPMKGAVMGAWSMKDWQKT